MLQLQNNKFSSEDIWCFLGERVLPETRSRALGAVTELIISVPSLSSSSIELDQETRKILESSLLGPLKEIGFEETSEQTPCYRVGQKGGLVTFVFGPNIRNLIFDRGEQLLKNTNRNDALMFFGFQPGLQLGTLEGVNLPYTQVRPMGYVILKSDGVNLEPQNYVFGSPEFIVVLCEQIGFRKVSTERFLVLHAKRREVSTKGVDKGSNQAEDQCTLLFVDSLSLFWDCESSFSKNTSDKSHLLFRLENLDPKQRLIARDWLAFLKRFIDSLPYQLETRANLKIIG